VRPYLKIDITWVTFNLSFSDYVYGRFILVIISRMFLFFCACVYVFFLSLTFFGNHRARAWHYRRGINMKRNRTNRSLFFRVSFLLRKKPHAMHTFAYFFFFVFLCFSCLYVVLSHIDVDSFATNITPLVFIIIIIIINIYRCRSWRKFDS